MNERLTISYETMGASSYMTIVCPADIELIHYQLETLLSNQIKNFLAVSRQLINGETAIYYHITSQIPLSQVLEKRKLKRKELFNLVEGLRLAIQDASAYRLPSEGILLEPAYIYVNPASCKPSFLYLPTETASEYGLRDLIADLIMHDQIEMTNDNLIQMLLKEINSQPFSIEQLEKSLKSGQERKAEEKRIPNIQEKKSVYPQTVRTSTVSAAAPEIVPDRPEIVPDRPVIVPDRIVAGAETESRRPDTPSLPQGKAAEKKLFLLPQAGIMVLVAAGISFGLFVDETGKIAVNTVLAAVIVIVLAEVILYREIFVNRKGKTVQEKDKPVKPAPGRPPAPGKPSVPGKPPAPGKPPVPGKLPAPGKPPVPEKNSVQGTASVPERPPVLQSKVPVLKPVQPVYLDEDDTDISGETELWDGAGEDGMDAYLEYYENNQMMKIPVNGAAGIIIGRLESQVDFAVKNPKVGKVHAKFFCNNNRCYVVDINSKNGTYINGSRTRIESNSPYMLHDKDRITLADTEFIIRCAEN